RSFDVASRLKPSVELAVPEEKELEGRAAGDDGARGDVAVRVGAEEVVRGTGEEVADPVAAAGFVGGGGGGRGERGELLGRGQGPSGDYCSGEKAPLTPALSRREREYLRRLRRD